MTKLSDLDLECQRKLIIALLLLQFTIKNLATSYSADGIGLIGDSVVAAKLIVAKLTSSQISQELENLYESLPID